MQSDRLSRAALALIVIAVLLTGVVIGSAVSALGVGSPSVTPTQEPVVSAPVATPRPTLPPGDVDGEDLDRLPRFPGSVRSAFAIDTDTAFRLTTTEYLAASTIDEVRAFYQGVITAHGWQRADVAYAGGEWTYVLVDGRVEGLIEIEETGGLIEIDLQISEPVPQQPASSPTPVPPTAPPPPSTGDDDDDDDDDDDGDDGDSDADGTDD